MSIGKKISTKPGVSISILFCAAVLGSLGLFGCGGGGDSGHSPAISPLGTNTATLNGTATATLNGTAVLSWDAETAPTLTGYRIYYGTAPRTYFQAYGQGVPVGNVTTYTVAGLTSGTRYYFAVTAYDSSNIESTYSSEVLKDLP